MNLDELENAKIVDSPFRWRELFQFAFIPTGRDWRRSGFSLWIGPVLITVDVYGYKSPYLNVPLISFSWRPD